jgi:ParB family chromosome partitioning protein
VAEENVYQIIAGERRYRASRRAGLARVPCLVEDVPPTQPTPPRVEILVEQISENWQRADLKPLELSDALAELRDALAIGPRELAKRLSKPESEVSRLLSLQKIDPQLRKQAAEDGSPFTRRHLLAVAQLPASEQPEVVARVRAGNLTAVETEKVVAELRREPAEKPAARRMSSRRFAIGGAVVEVRFRKRTVTDEEVIDVLERATRLVRNGGEADER